MEHTPTRKGLALGLLWRMPIPLWVIYDGKLVRAKLVRCKDSPGVGTHTHTEGTHPLIALAYANPTVGEKALQVNESKAS